MRKELTDGLNIIFDKAHHKQLWNSTLIGPNTYRIWTTAGEYRVCLHQVEKNNMVDASMHAHAWPASFLVVQGKYNVNLGYFTARDSSVIEKLRGLSINSGSAYEMNHPLEAHQAFPVTDSWAIMVNRPKFRPEEIHQSAIHKVKSIPASLPREELGRRIDSFMEVIMNNRDTSLKGWL